MKSVIVWFQLELDSWGRNWQLALASRPTVQVGASPLTTFFIDPIAELIFIPFMTTGAGVGLIGGWFGTGADRGLALVFTLTGIIGLIMTLIAMNTKYYKLLSERYITDNNTALPTPELT